MTKLYNTKTTLHPVLQWTAAAVCAAAYFLCCVPSFNMIGQFAVQILLSVCLSLVCTLLLLVIIPHSLTVIGKGLSLYLVSMLLIAAVQQIRAQMSAGQLSGWKNTFFYDKPLTVAVVWACAFVLLTSLRLFQPYNASYLAFRKDYVLFFKEASGTFLVFYICVLVYCFFLQRRPGGESGVNLIPFSMISSYLATASYAYESIFYLLGNLLCFFPFGFYYRIYKRDTNIVFMLLTPVVLSVLLEVSQLLFGMGDFDIDDILMNAVGFYVGYSLSFVIDRIRQARTAGEETTIFVLKEA